ncbi:MAG: ABC transporter ATP-binding protein [Pseudomonadota bacterium]
MTEAGPVLEVKGVSKSYRVYAHPRDRLREALGLWGKRLHDEVYALSNIEFSVPRGEVLGIVGHNGAGKSTLLKIVAGLIPPSEGTVRRHGALSTLLDLGAGVNLEQSGRDNARFLASLDASAEDHSLDERLADIVAFADIGDMIDKPMKYYSHGMRARVAFAAATNIRPDLLIVDEVLAVGDSRFQRKCYARMEALMGQGSTVLFVSHDNQTIVEFCRRAILLDRGELVADGDPASVVRDYVQRLDSNAGDASEPEGVLHDETTVPVGYLDPELVVPEFSEVRNSEISLETITLLDEQNRATNVVRSGDQLSLEVTYRCEKQHEQAVLPISIKSKKGVELIGRRHPVDHTTLTLRPGRTTLRIEFRCPLLEGDYFVSVGITSLAGGDRTVLYRGDDCLAFRVLKNPALVRWGFVELAAQSSVRFEATTAGAAT